MKLRDIKEQTPTVIKHAETAMRVIVGLLILIAVGVWTVALSRPPRTLAS